MLYGSSAVAIISLGYVSPWFFVVWWIVAVIPYWALLDLRKAKLRQKREHRDQLMRSIDLKDKIAKSDSH
ncbi:hypothetical protein TW80_09820 [Loktanella sp. S4079]|nr:hypothetical protein TW80_09820 [Loktanella sp. S4079]